MFKKLIIIFTLLIIVSSISGCCCCCKLFNIISDSDKFVNSPTPLSSYKPKDKVVVEVKLFKKRDKGILSDKDICLIYHVSVTNNGYTEAVINDLDFVLVVDNVEYQRVLLLSSDVEEEYGICGLEQTTLRHGGKVDGLLLFDIPYNYKNIQSFEYKTTSMDDFSVKVKFNQ